MWTFSDLQSNVTLHNRRGDTANFFVLALKIAESRLQKDIKSWKADKSASLTYAAGDDRVLLPADLLELKSASNGGREYRIITPQQRIEYFNHYYDSYLSQTASLEEGYLKFVRPAGAAGEVKILYKSQLAPLSAANPSNWLLTDEPALYLYAVLVALAVITEDDDKIARYERQYAAQLQMANSQSAYTGTNAHAVLPDAAY
jgi:hypothetical protein